MCKLNYAVVLLWIPPFAVHASTETTTGFFPLTTVFSPAPECTSLTIVHVQREVDVYTGCVGEDPSCCPSTGRANNTYSPAVCPSGYVTHDAHVGLDRLAIDTEEWQATCIPRYELSVTAT